MLGEITMVQLYKVALTAGKAHKDHKHHHAHKYDHNGTPITTTPQPSPIQRPATVNHPLLIGGQLNPEAALNIAQQNLQPTPQIIQGQNYNAQLLNGQFIGNLVSQQLSQNQANQGGSQPLIYRIPQQLTSSQSPVQPQTQLISSQMLQLLPSSVSSSQLNPRIPSSQFSSSQFSSPQNDLSSFSQQSISIRGSPLINSGLVHPSLVNPANVQYVDNTQLDQRFLSKRNNKESSPGLEEDKVENEEKEFGKKLQKVKREVAETDGSEKEFGQRLQKAKRNVQSENKDVESKHSKRELFLTGNGYVDGALVSSAFDQNLLDGLAGIGQNEPVLSKQKQSDEREPAEAEVKAVMNVCSGCDEEPFSKALVFGWRTVTKKLYSGAYYMPAVTECRVF